MKAQLFKFIIRHRRYLVGLLIGISVLAAASLGNLTVIFDPSTALPQTHPYVDAANRARDLFGVEHTIIIAVTPKTGDAFQPEVLGKIQSITKRVLGLSNVVPATVLSVASPRARNISGEAGVLDVTPLMSKVPNTAEDLANLRQRLLSNPLYDGILMSTDGRTLFVVAGFNIAKNGFRPHADPVSAIVESERSDSIDIRVGGDTFFAALIEHYSMRMGPLFLIAVLIIGLIHYEAFRTIQSMVLPLVSALLAVLWSVGIMGVFNVALDPFNATTPILILAIAAGHAVQILKRYYEDYADIRSAKPDLDKREASHLAIVQSMCKVGPVMIAAGLVAAASFFSLLVFQLDAIRSFGIFTGLGILSTLILEVVFIPAIRASLPAPGLVEAKHEAKATHWDRIARGCGEAVLFHKRAILMATLVGASVMLFFGARVEVNGTNEGFFYGNIQPLKDYEFLKVNFAGTHVLYGILESDEADYFKRPEALIAVEKIQRYSESLPSVGKTTSLVDFVKRMNFAMNDNNPTFNTIPDTQDLISQYLFLYTSSGDPGDMEPYVDDDYKAINTTFLLKTNPNTYVEEFIAKVTAYAKTVLDPRIKFKIGGNGAGAAALSQVLVPEKLMNMAQIAMIVFIASSLVFRSMAAGCLIVVPLALTVIANFGIMGLLSIPLQVATAVTSAMGVGIGADYAIYLFYRIREEYQRDRNETAAFRRAFASSGKAILFVSSAVAGGYSVLMLSYGFSIHFWLGLLVTLSMIVSSICSLTIFPCLITLVRPRAIYNVVDRTSSRAA